MKKIIGLAYAALMLGALLISCNKEATPTPETHWNKVSAIDEIASVSATAVGSSNLYMVGYGLNGYYFVSMNKVNQIVEKRSITTQGEIYLNKDFYTVVQYGASSTVLSFFSTALNQVDPIAIIDSRDLRNGTTGDQFKVSSVQISRSSVNDNIYGIILEYGPEASTNVDVANLQIENGSLKVTNKLSVGIFPAEKTLYLSTQTESIVAFKDKFLIKLSESLYQYSTVVSPLLNVPPNYDGNTAVEIAGTDTLYMESSLSDFNYLYYTTDFNGNWGAIKRPNNFNPNFSLNSFIGSLEGGFSSVIKLYKVDRTNEQLVLYSSDVFKGLDDSGSVSSIAKFGDNIYCFQLNAIYYRPVSSVISK